MTFTYVRSIAHFHHAVSYVMWDEKCSSPRFWNQSCPKVACIRRSLVAKTIMVHSHVEATWPCVSATYWVGSTLNRLCGSPKLKQKEPHVFRMFVESSSSYRGLLLADLGPLVTHLDLLTSFDFAVVSLCLLVANSPVFQRHIT